MATSSVPAIQFTPTGLVLPQESAILSGVQTDINRAFGGGVNPALETPQGQIAQSTTAIIGDSNDQFAHFVNQIDPDRADGFMQDAIARIYFIDRKPATATAVQCDCVGLAGTVIPMGARAKDGSGNIYVAAEAGTIPPSGTISLPFECLETGPIACPANTLDQIYKAIPGWDTINNPADGLLGTLTENRADFEYRRRQSVAINAKDSLASIYAAVFDLDDVTDVYCTQNVGDHPTTIGGVMLVPHSVYVAVSGGDPADIANAIWAKKSLGCNYNGNTSVEVTDTSGYNAPYPKYMVKFQEPAPLPIFISVTVQNQSGLSNADIASMVKAAIVGAFVGEDGGARARIGSTIYASRYYSPVGRVAPLAVISIFVGLETMPAENSVSVDIDSVPTLSADNISVAFL